MSKEPENPNPSGKNLIGWDRLRSLVWERDNGTCQVCGLDMRKMQAWYDCGHIVDRISDGPDELDNLVVMCLYCNQCKPPHSTKEEYEHWLKAGYWFTSDFSTIRERLALQLERIKSIDPGVDVNIDIDRILRNIQLEQLREATGQPTNPKRDWHDEFYREWKVHE